MPQALSVGETQPLSMGRLSQRDPIRHSYDKVHARFPINATADAFRQRFFPGVGKAEWNDWRWQLRNRLRTVEDLARVFSLDEAERVAVSAHKGRFRSASRRTTRIFSIDPTAPRGCAARTFPMSGKISWRRTSTSTRWARTGKARFPGWYTDIRIGCCSC